MLEGVIIADTSSLIALSNIEELEILKKLYNEVYITDEIKKEFGEEFPVWIKVAKVKDKAKVKMLELDLDKGEASAIVLALESSASSKIIIDEKKGRTIAKKLKLNVTGVLGILIKAKLSGIITHVKPVLEKLENANFRVSEKLRREVLSKANEL